MSLVYIDEPIHPEALARLGEHHQLVLGFGPQAVPFAEVSGEVSGMLMRNGYVTADMIEASPSLEVIARHGVGYDKIDIAAAHRQGVQVLITPQANAVSVAEHTIGLLIAAARRYSESDQAVRDGRFTDRDELIGVELAGRTLAIAGYGRIGARVAAVAQALDMRLRIYDPYLPAHRHPEAMEFAADLTELLTGAEALTLHLPLTDATRGMIGPDQLDLLARGALVVNTARGGLIQEAALAERLTDGRLTGAGLDVFASEPQPPHDSALLTTASAQLAPHTGAHTTGAIYKMAMHAAAGILAVLAGDSLPETVAPVLLPTAPQPT